MIENFQFQTLELKIFTGFYCNVCLLKLYVRSLGGDFAKSIWGVLRGKFKISLRHRKTITLGNLKYILMHQDYKSNLSTKKKQRNWKTNM